jgi:hypothetical protein
VSAAEAHYLKKIGLNVSDKLKKCDASEVRASETSEQTEKHEGTERRFGFSG